MNRYRYVDERGEHLHLLDNRPLIGTSRVGNVVAKPLTWWASGLAVQTFGVPDPKVLTKIKRKKATAEEIAVHESAVTSFFKQLQRMQLDDYLALLDAAYRAHDVSMREKAKGGTDLHAEVERYVKYRMGHIEQQGALFPRLPEWDPQIQPFIAWSKENVKRFLWSEGHTFSEKMWTGGISDMGCEMINGNYSIVDIKSSREAYPSQFMQVAGYDLQIEESGIVDADGNHLYSLEKPVSEYYIFTFGGEQPMAYPYDNISGARQAFQNALALYKFLPQE